jgi:alpha-1,2-glucosyltransferase
MIKIVTLDSHFSNSYLVSYLLFRLTGSCSIATLRATNAGFLVINAISVYTILKTLYCSSRRAGNTALNYAHIAANVCLFPPLFFFSGLYYTDIQSARYVLLAYQQFCKSRQENFKNGHTVFLQILYGFMALLFRQTNIFWVAVFPAGLTVVEMARRAGRGAQRKSEDSSFLHVLQEAWEHKLLFDLPVENAYIEDYAKTVLSIAVVAVLNLKRVIPALIPYMFLLGSFAAFVVWNGGVVLGEYSLFHSTNTC